eukprot:IDg22810t1
MNPMQLNNGSFVIGTPSGDYQFRVSFNHLSNEHSVPLCRSPHRSSLSSTPRTKSQKRPKQLKNRILFSASRPSVTLRDTFSQNISPRPIIAKKKGKAHVERSPSATISTAAQIQVTPTGASQQAWAAQAYRMLSRASRSTCPNMPSTSNAPTPMNVATAAPSISALTMRTPTHQTGSAPHLPTGRTTASPSTQSSVEDRVPKTQPDDMAVLTDIRDQLPRLCTALDNFSATAGNAVPRSAYGSANPEYEPLADLAY